MVRIMHVFCTGNNCVTKDQFRLTMFEMDNRGILFSCFYRQVILLIQPPFLGRAKQLIVAKPAAYLFLKDRSITIYI